MEYDLIIENLSQNEIQQLYDNILETNVIDFLSAWYCYAYCRCNANYATYAYGYQNEDRTYADYYNGWRGICTNDSYHISGGCGSSVLSGRIVKCYS